MPKIKLTDEAVWNWKATEIMFKLVAEYRVFTADDYYALARQIQMPPAYIAKSVSALFKSFQASGYIRKTDKFRLSNRNDSSPLPEWESKKLKVDKGNDKGAC